MRRSTSSREAGSIIADRNRRRAVARAGPAFVQGAGEAPGLQKREVAREGFALDRQIEQPLAAVSGPGLLSHVAVVNEVAQYAAKALLGDLQDIEQVRDAHAGMAIDEMKHAMVRAAEAEPGKQFVGVADEVAIGEEQKLDQIVRRTARRVPESVQRDERIPSTRLCQPC